jgi:death-on-curing protein
MTLSNATKLDLADSALHAPSASFGDEEFYPDFCDKAAVLMVRLVKNHPLLDVHKRAAWVLGAVACMSGPRQYCSGR